MELRSLVRTGVLAALSAAFWMASPALAQRAEGKPAPRVEIRWLGGPTTAIEFNGLTILTDPMFGEGAEAFTMGDPNEKFDLKAGPNVRAQRRLTPFPGVRLADVDLVLVSHAHEDHFDQKADADLDRAVLMVVPSADVAKVGAKGFRRLEAMIWGQTRQYKAGSGLVKITAVPAHHSRDPQIDKFLGKGNGYWIEFSDGDWKRTLYWTGDTMPSEDVIAWVKSFGRPDILMPHLARVGTPGSLGQVSMGADDVVALADRIQPKKILPIHHSTYAFYLEPIGALAVKSAGKAYGLDLISEGTTLVYD